MLAALAGKPPYKYNVIALIKSPSFSFNSAALASYPVSINH